MCLKHAKERSWNFCTTNNRRRKKYNKIIKFAQPGDIIKCSRLFRTYYHFAIYIGNGEVIHFAKDDTNEDNNSKVFIKRESLWEAIGGNICTRVFVMYCCRHEDCRCKTRTVERAFEFLGEDGYNIQVNNCETFVYRCVHGVDYFTGQVIRRYILFDVLRHIPKLLLKFIHEVDRKDGTFLRFLWEILPSAYTAAEDIGGKIYQIVTEHNDITCDCDYENMQDNDKCKICYIMNIIAGIRATIKSLGHRLHRPIRM